MPHQDLDLARALLDVQDAVNKTTRREVRRARREFGEKFAEMKTLQEAERARVDRHDRDLARLEERTRPTARRFFGSLSIKQKAALLSAAISGGGIVLERAWSLGTFLATVYAKGLHP